MAPQKEPAITKFDDIIRNSVFDVPMCMHAEPVWPDEPTECECGECCPEPIAFIPCMRVATHIEWFVHDGQKLDLAHCDEHR